MLDQPVFGRATFSECGRYRYFLSRSWDKSLGKVMFIGLHPEHATANTNDHLIDTATELARSWGVGGFIFGNLFAFQTSVPGKICTVPDPIGEENLACLVRMSSPDVPIVACWGNWGTYMDAQERVMKLFPLLHCLDVTSDGHPVKLDKIHGTKCAPYIYTAKGWNHVKNRKQRFTTDEF